MQAERIAYVQEYKRKRDQEPVKRALQTIYDLTKRQPEANIFEARNGSRSVEGYYAGDLRCHERGEQLHHARMRMVPAEEIL